jgi:hypothetical protein
MQSRYRDIPAAAVEAGRHPGTGRTPYACRQNVEVVRDERQVPDWARRMRSRRVYPKACLPIRTSTKREEVYGSVVSIVRGDRSS